MRRALAAAAFVAALSGGPALAQSIPAGYLGIFGGGGFSALGPVYVMGLEGAAAFSVGPVHAQLETRGAAFFTAPTPSTIESGFVHGFWRDANHAAGGYFGFEPATLPGNVSGIWHFGGEAQFYIDRLTLYGQAAYLRINANGTVEPGWYVRLSARFFPRENLRLQADLRYMDLGGLLSGWTVGGTAEYQLRGRPISLVGTVRHTVGSGVPSTAVMAGFRINLGHGTLAEQATPMETLPVTF
jgi:hypothetical protein